MLLIEEGDTDENEKELTKIQRNVYVFSKSKYCSCE